MTQDKNSHFPIFLRDAMQKRNFTQAKLAGDADTSQSNISRYLKSEGMPRAEELLRLSKALGVTMEWLLTGESVDGKVSGITGTETARLKPSTRKALKDASAALERLKNELDPQT